MFVFNFKMNPLICQFGGNESESETIVRFAPYIEDAHAKLLSSVSTATSTAVADNPFADQDEIDVEKAFFGVGYVISSFPSMYDMFGKFMAGLDVDTLYNQIFEDTVNSGEVNALVAAEDALRQDEIDMISMPDIELGARNVNSVVSSVFPIAQAAVYDGKVKAIEQFSAKLRYGLIPVVADRWKTHLNWNEQVISSYGHIFKLYYMTKLDVSKYNNDVRVKDTMWPLSARDFLRSVVGALQGATTTSSSTKESPDYLSLGLGVLSGIAGFF